MKQLSPAQWGTEYLAMIMNHPEESNEPFQDTHTSSYSIMDKYGRMVGFYMNMPNDILPISELERLAEMPLADAIRCGWKMEITNDVTGEVSRLP